MKITIILLALFSLLFSGAIDAVTPVSVSYWTSTYYTDGTYSNFLALSGHTTEGDGPTADNCASIMPTGTFTKLAVVTNDPGTPGWTRTATVYKNKNPTAATCTVPNGSFTCSWTGSVTFSEGDLANIRIEAGGGLIIKAPWSIMTVFTVSGSGRRDWPFTA